jgi:hypothetical protein
MSPEKTIRMPKPLLDKWLAALRSSSIDGKPIRQAREVLHNGRGGYCCLGVLQVCAAGRVSKNRKDDVQLPSFGWLVKHGVDFLSERGVRDDCPYLPQLCNSAAEANDNGQTFAEIADAIEACAEGI